MVLTGRRRIHGRRQRGVGGGRAPTLWIFKHGTNIVDKGLKMLFSAFFAIFRSFFRCPPPSRKIFCRHPWEDSELSRQNNLRFILEIL